MRVSLVDYGVGNLFSVRRALEQVGAEVVPARDAKDVRAARHLVLPGVGAFRHCADALTSHGLWEPIREHALSGRPFLGICVGMQLMMQSSEEFGHHRGFGLIEGSVLRLPRSADRSHKIPSIGWRRLACATNSPVFAPLDGRAVYFVHSYAPTTTHAADVLATYCFGGRAVTAAIGRGAMLGAQFHPEKSGPDGLGLLRRFLAL